MNINLRRIRRQRLLTMRDLAARSGMTAASISRIENGQVQPRFSTIRRLANALHVTPEELAGIADEEKQR